MVRNANATEYLKRVSKLLYVRENQIIHHVVIIERLLDSYDSNVNYAQIAMPKVENNAYFWELSLLCHAKFQQFFRYKVKGDKHKLFEQKTVTIILPNGKTSTFTSENLKFAKRMAAKSLYLNFYH